MIFLIVNSALATLIDDPFLVPKQYTGTNSVQRNRELSPHKALSERISSNK